MLFPGDPISVYHKLVGDGFSSGILSKKFIIAE
jgi:hypothetical protein